MRKAYRQVVRTRGNYSQMVCHFAYAQTSPRWKEWKFRSISLRQALQLVKDGEATPITRDIDGTIYTVGFQALSPTAASRPSATTLTVATTLAVGNAAALPGQRPALTPQERAEILKFELWPFIHDTRAALTGPRATPAECRKAMRLAGVIRLQTSSCTAFARAA